MLERTLQDATAGGGYRIERIDTGLEDVFIHLMQGATDNFGDDAAAAKAAKREAPGSGRVR